jgi:hypothetical protein
MAKECCGPIPICSKGKRTVQTRCKAMNYTMLVPIKLPAHMGRYPYE